MRDDFRVKREGSVSANAAAEPEDQSAGPPHMARAVRA